MFEDFSFIVFFLSLPFFLAFDAENSRIKPIAFS